MNDRNTTRPTRDEVYDLLMNARQADWVELFLEDGRALSGAIIFNEFKGTGPPSPGRSTRFNASTP